MAKETLNRDELIRVIHSQKGKIGLAAEVLGVNSRTIYRYAEKYTTVQQAIDESRSNFDETLVDAAESKLRSAVINGEAWAIKYTLDTKGRKRGYVTRHELEHSVNVQKLSDAELDHIINSKTIDTEITLNGISVKGG